MISKSIESEQWNYVYTAGIHVTPPGSLLCLHNRLLLFFLWNWFCILDNSYFYHLSHLSLAYQNIFNGHSRIFDFTLYSSWEFSSIRFWYLSTSPWKTSMNIALWFAFILPIVAISALKWHNTTFPNGYSLKPTFRKDCLPRSLIHPYLQKIKFSCTLF